VNASIRGDTVGDIAWRAAQILALAQYKETQDSSPTNMLPPVQYVIINAGANNLAKLGSTQSNEIGSSRVYNEISKQFCELALNIHTGLPNTKLGVLTPVYRGDLNDNDQLNLRSNIKNTTAYSSAPDFIKDSWDVITSVDISDPEVYKDSKNLAGGGYFAFSYLMQELMTNMPAPAVTRAHANHSDIRLASIQQPLPKNKIDYKRERRSAWRQIWPWERRGCQGAQECLAPVLASVLKAGSRYIWG
jgi:hypothetical protein